MAAATLLLARGWAFARGRKSPPAIGGIGRSRVKAGLRPDRAIQAAWSAFIKEHLEGDDGIGMEGSRKAAMTGQDLKLTLVRTRVQRVMNDVEVAVLLSCSKFGPGRLDATGWARQISDHARYRCVRPAESGRVGIEGPTCLTSGFTQSAAGSKRRSLRSGAGCESGSAEALPPEGIIFSRYGQGIRIGDGPERGRQPPVSRSAARRPQPWAAFFRPAMRSAASAETPSRTASRIFALLTRREKLEAVGLQ